MRVKCINCGDTMKIGRLGYGFCEKDKLRAEIRPTKTDYNHIAGILFIIYSLFFLNLFHKDYIEPTILTVFWIIIIGGALSLFFGGTIANKLYKNQIRWTISEDTQ